ncbi:MAG: hypothetical protein JWR22_728 [Herminiimonas sp.]|nr:hypothetical protein [Herminiimonas sp.]
MDILLEAGLCCSVKQSSERLLPTNLDSQFTGVCRNIRRPGGSNEPLGMGAGSTPMLNH